MEWTSNGSESNLEGGLVRGGRSGLVRVRIEGQRRLYRLVPARFEEIQGWLAEPAAPRKTAKPIATFVDATDLVAWAGRRDAQAFLPKLVRRLILATTSKVSRVGARSGEGVQLTGWDGIVIAEAGNAFVPEGASAWEMGTNQNPRQKAQDDYKKRTQDSQGIDPEQTIFIFVTPRRWPGKNDWEAERRTEDVWRDVRVYDADDMETWLETAPAVHAWLSVRLGTHPKDALDLESVWEDWSHSTEPPIRMQLVLAGRKGLANKAIDWLVESSEITLALRAESSQEALAVFAAIVLNYLGSEREWLLSRIVVVDTVATWNALSLSNETLILIPRFEDDAALGRARRTGHRVVVPLGAESTSGSSEAVLRLARKETEEALRAMGIKEKKVRSLATLARRSMTCFRRKLSVRPEIQRPQWAQASAGRGLVPALLAGVWTDTSEADRAVLSTLARCDYETFSDSVSQWVGASDPPLCHVGDVFELVSREDSWTQLVQYVRHDDLERFRQVVHDVLGAPDPQFDLPLEERWSAGVHGPVPAHSSGLCEGLAVTLAIMGARGHVLAVAGGMTLRQQAESIARELLSRANQDTRLWLSLSHVLPLLAEAAPDVFLEAVEDGLKGDNPVVMGLFVEAPGPLVGSAHHTGLLRALESLAWSPDHLARAALVLATLTRLDPGGQWANRPAASLRAIFLPWLPQTTVGVEKRLGIIDRIRERAPDVSWKLMKELLPETHGTGHFSAKPQWREWAPDEDPKVKWSECFEAVEGVLRRMIEDADMIGSRWMDLVDALANLRPESYKAVLECLNALDPDSFADSDRTQIWAALRMLLSRHRSFPNAPWALSPDRLDALETVFARFEPLDVLTRFAWLFSDHVELPDGVDQDWDAKEDAVAAARVAAVEQIFEERGLEGLVAWVLSVERSFWLGEAMAQVSGISDSQVETLLATHLADPETKKTDFAQGFVHGKCRRSGLSWAKTMVLGPGQSWRQEQRGAFLERRRATPALLEIVSALDEPSRRAYWQRMDVWGVEPKDTVSTVRNLLQYQRPFAAIEFLDKNIRRGADVGQALIAETLEAAIETDQVLDEPGQSFSFYLVPLLDRLVPEGEVTEARIARIEWACQEFLRFDRPPKFLHAELRRNPSFFIEVLSLVYPSESTESTDVSDDQRCKAHLGYTLLDSWRTLPGSNDGGAINAQELREWINCTRQLGTECGRGAIADEVIGKVLSGSPPGQDRVWPAEAVRDVVEDCKSQDLERGFEIGKFNSRGVVQKSLAEGGEQERQLAKQYKKYAEAVGDRWPRTAAMLRRLADTYDSYARQEDDRSELLGTLD